MQASSLCQTGSRGPSLHTPIFTLDQLMGVSAPGRWGTLFIMAYSSPYRRCAAHTNIKILAVIGTVMLTMCMSSGSAQPVHWLTTQLNRSLRGLNETAIAGEESVFLVPTAAKVEGRGVLHVLLGDTVLENHLN